MRCRSKVYAAPDITFWSVWENGQLLGCGALKELDPQHGEIKSMRTASATCAKASRARWCITSSRKRNGAGYRRLSLETGSMAAFEPLAGFTPLLDLAT